MTLVTKLEGCSSSARKRRNLLLLLVFRSLYLFFKRPMCCTKLQIHQSIEQLRSSIGCRRIDRAAQSVLLLPLLAGRPCSTISDSSSTAHSTGQNPAELRCENQCFVLCSCFLLWWKLLSASVQEGGTFQRVWDLQFCKETPSIPKVKKLCPKVWVLATGKMSDFPFCTCW